MRESSGPGSRTSQQLVLLMQALTSQSQGRHLVNLIAEVKLLSTAHRLLFYHPKWRRSQVQVSAYFLTSASHRLRSARCENATATCVTLA